MLFALSVSLFFAVFIFWCSLGKNPPKKNFEKRNDKYDDKNVSAVNRASMYLWLLQFLVFFLFFLHLQQQFSIFIIRSILIIFAVILCLAHCLRLYVCIMYIQRHTIFAFYGKKKTHTNRAVHRLRLYLSYFLYFSMFHVVHGTPFPIFNDGYIVANKLRAKSFAKIKRQTCKTLCHFVYQSNQQVFWLSNPASKRHGKIFCFPLFTFFIFFIFTLCFCVLTIQIRIYFLSERVKIVRFFLLHQRIRH